MKRLFGVFIAAIAMLLTCSAFTACANDGEGTNKHTHFAENYTVDYLYEDQLTSHWKVCDTCNEIFDKAEHTFVDGYCTVCNYSEEGSIGLKYTPITHKEDTNSAVKRIIAYSVSGIGTATDKDIIIPSYYLGKAVTQIDDRAFKECSNVTSVSIGRNVTSIGSFAFYNCINLESAEIPDSVTSVGTRAFYGSGLKSVSMGNGVTSLASEVFGGTPFFDDGMNWQDEALYIGQYLISVNSMTSEEFSVKQGTRLIADRAFVGCNALSGVNIPETVKYIGTEAFYQCEGLLSLSVPDSVFAIGPDAFAKCSGLKDITLGSGLREYYFSTFQDTAYYKDRTKWTDGVLYIGQHLVATDTSVVSEDYTVKEGTLTIASGTFFVAVKLKSITIPDSVLWIGANVLSNCSVLGEAHIGSGVKHIGMNAFNSCHGLREMTYNGTIEQWLAIELVDGYIDGGLYFTLQCSDGKLDKKMNIIQ